MDQRELSREEQLHQLIDNGRITDRDIADIENHGDRRLRRHLEERTSYLEKERDHIDRVYGKGMFDGRDSNGKLYKNLDSTEIHKQFLDRNN